jgi:hypothetical protein
MVSSVTVPVSQAGSRALRVRDTERVTSPDLQARYGRRTSRTWDSAGRKKLLAVAGVLLLIAIVAAMFAWQQSVQSDVTGRLLSYDVVADDSVTVQVEVRKPADQLGICTVQAKNKYAEVVGSLDVTTPSGKPATTVAATVRTRERAVVAQVLACRLG